MNSISVAPSESRLDNAPRARVAICTAGAGGLLYQLAFSSLLVAAGAVVTVLAAPYLSRENDIMIYFLAAYLAAFRFGLVSALWACFLSVLCFDFFVTPPVYEFDPVFGHHIFTMIMMCLLIFACSERTARVRSYARNLEDKIRERTAALELSNRDLQEEVNRRRDAETTLEKTVDELARSNSRLQQFARIASHDLQEPLKVIQGYVNLFARRYGGQLDHSADDFIAYILDATLRMEKLIKGVLQHAAVSSQVQAFELTDSNCCFAEARANLAETIGDTGAFVSAASLPEVCANPVQLTQLFQNLIGNALKFNESGGARVHVSAFRLEREWMFAVADNGIGIAPEYLERIFGLFSRLHSTGDYPGTGLGLAICKAIVDHHKGRIWVESTPGEGSTFFFTIPDAK